MLRRETENIPKNCDLNGYTGKFKETEQQEQSRNSQRFYRDFTSKQC